MNELNLNEKLEKKIMNLSQFIWERRVDGKSLQKWLDNFSDAEERTHALFLLSNFHYFGTREIRVMLKNAYTDKILKPIIHKARMQNGNTKNFNSISKTIEEEISQTRFVGVGNPSESGTHLLYYFRQENNIPKDQFINSHEILKIQRSPIPDISLKTPEITRYVFIDDMCGSGTQAKDYSENLVSNIKNINSDIEVIYLALFSTSSGLSVIKDETDFDKVDCVFELDSSFKAFGSKSRYFERCPDGISRDVAKRITKKYGERWLDENDALGFKNGQLLLGFSHNTPDNSLPIFWYEDPTWSPIFKRHHKYY